ncbi:MAG: 4Fe-4S dicluster domain-containing protein [Chloroflexi bacterium]|nr:4Fe-4S dicluster domain-containing protein [Chloroflexota bacterium]
MRAFFDTLKIDYGLCPPGCTLCEEACARGNGNGAEPVRIAANHLPEVDFHNASVCHQCGQPRCLEICPVGAITKSDGTGVVHIDSEKCVGCSLCTLACPYGSIRYNVVEKKSYKCEQCDGEPRCVAACKHGVLSYLKNRNAASYIQCEDRVTPGNMLCVGCGAELALRFTFEVLGKDFILFNAPGCAFLGCGTMMPEGMFAKVPMAFCLLTNVDALMTGVKRYYKNVGRDVRLVAFVGDGATADAGFQALSGAAERGENIIHICYDNEAYMNTGIQRSSTTPFQSWSTTTPVGRKIRGKQEPTKYMPLIMAFHGVPYVATASVAHLEDYARKLTKAMAVKDGMAYVHLFSPCPTGWRAPTESSVELSRMAVETNYFPLWEAEHGEFRLTHEPRLVRPVQDYTSLMGRFNHLKEDDLAEFQKTVDDRMALLKHLCAM